jgi:mannosyl-3-phosphoglycerate phosphatase family protein
MKLLFASDLDACLLDEETYSHEPASEALAALEAQDVPLVLVSSKTLAEIEALVDQLRIRHPFIVENGGAVAIPPEIFRGAPGAAHDLGDWSLLPLGVPRAKLIAALPEIAREAGTEARGFHTLSDAELGSLAGLTRGQTLRARRRDFDEPFVLDDLSRIDDLRRAAERRGLTVTQGGRFFHLHGGSDKGRALHVVLGLYRDAGRMFRTAGLGDAANDLPLLRAVDRPIIIPHADGEVDAALAQALPAAERAPVPGPAGWNRAVLTVLSGGTLPGLTAARQAEGADSPEPRGG